MTATQLAGARTGARLDRLPPSRWHRRLTLTVGVGADRKSVV